jgi:hypothetical protein
MSVLQPKMRSRRQNFFHLRDEIVRWNAWWSDEKEVHNERALPSDDGT